MNVKAFKTQQNELPMRPVTDFVIQDDPGAENKVINIHPEVEYQTVTGFGGAFTEASSTTLDKMSPEKRERILKLYFDPEEGIGYNAGRVHINSCDFSLGNYTYVEEGDETLATFSIEHDRASILPMIKEAMQYGEIELLASPWSPPPYMKTTGMMNRGGRLKDEYYPLWAEYFKRFIEEYQKEGVKVTSVTVQNEPKAVQPWDSCIWTAEEERDFIRDHLGPRMQDMGVKLFFWDHNKERVVERAKVVLGDAEAAKYVAGSAFHWYSGDHFAELEMFNRLYPDKELVFSEGCYEYSLGMTDVVKIGERYAHDMIGNFNNHMNAFLDWNLLLDEKGGPNHVGNFCDSPIMADTKNDEILIHTSYYYIGHFSKYVKKGAKRIGTSRFSDAVEAVSFKNPDGTIVSVVLNRTDADVDFSFRLCGKLIGAKAEAHSIATYLFND